MTAKNPNIDLCGIKNLLLLLEGRGFTKSELDKVLQRIAVQSGANILLIS